MSDLCAYISKESFTQPRILSPSTTFGHAPFFFWLVSVLSPKNIVELGSANGFSFFVLCQAAEKLDCEAQCYAVDTWEGDIHTGKYGNSIYESVESHLLSGFDRNNCHLLRMEFKKAAERFETGSIDLLFIDGCHTYDAVREDFFTWKDKMSERGVVLFHDTQVDRQDFGVKKFWGEITAEYPNIEFHHDHGLGVLIVGKQAPQPLQELASEPESRKEEVRQVYAAIGEKYNTQWQLATQKKVIGNMNYELDLVRRSASWRLTAPLRWIDRRIISRRQNKQHS